MTTAAATRTTTAVYQTDRDTFPFQVTCTLAQRAPEPAPKGATWKESADKWAVTIHETLYGGKIEIEYWTGVGHRSRRPGATPGTVYYYETAQCVAPDAESVLYSFGSDVQTAENMPDVTADAMDYLQAEYGHEGKASDLLRLVEDLRSARDKAKALLRNTGIHVAHFADWTQSLDS